MSRDRSRLRIIANVFHWIGVAAAVVCFGLIVAGHSPLASRFEYTRLPVSWVVAGLAIFALLMAELCNSASATQQEHTKLINPEPPRAKSTQSEPTKTDAAHADAWAQYL
jgi:hypothetical protein